jgi:hypothetical protein
MTNIPPRTYLLVRGEMWGLAFVVQDESPYDCFVDFLEIILVVPFYI